MKRVPTKFRDSYSDGNDSVSSSIFRIVKRVLEEKTAVDERSESMRCKKSRNEEPWPNSSS